MRILSLTLSVVAVIMSMPAQTMAEEPWVALFQKNSTEGWTPRGEVVSFEVKKGVTHLLATKNIWVVSTRTMKDFVVEAEIKLPADAKETGFNSGLAFRCTGAYQCEVDRKQPGGVYGIGLGGWLYPKKEQMQEYQEKIKEVYRPGEFNLYRVEAIGPKIRTWANGTLIAEIEHDASLEGAFGIQHHGKGGTVLFRNVRARELKP